MRIRLTGSSNRFLKRLNQVDAERIIGRIQALADNPYPNDVKRIENSDVKAFRVRVGKYRILFAILPGVLLIIRIDKRSRVYDR